MTIYKSTAVVSGVMPDKTIPGLVLCRTGEYTTLTDNMVSGDTIQMVPIPNGAKILMIQFSCNAAEPSLTGIDIGDGTTLARFFDGVTGSHSGIHVFGGAVTADSGDNAALAYDYAADDTIDLTLVSLASKIPTSKTFKLNVWYKMAGSMDDED